ncbi:MAG: NTP transferase domain-containing protein, partial [Arenimonas sp.]|uniref:NTP transferase domain-containing protein n=1 Tax=Arenimonas sp. TaxID=1872635 RepID=UPI0025C1B94B
MIPRTAITLGVLAGGRGQRLGGRDKAWVMHHGKTLLQHTLSAFPGGYAERLVSTRADDARFTKMGLRAVLDQRPDFAGPLAALEALCAACTTPWLLTVPVDVQRIPDDLAEALRSA